MDHGPKFENLGYSSLAILCFTLSFNLQEDNSHREKLWHPSVRVFNVHDENGKHISNLVIDPYIRAKKIDSIWSYSGRDCSLTTHAKPLAYLHMNVQDLGASTTLSFDQVKKIFYEVSFFWQS